MRDRAADRRLMRYLHGELPAEEVRKLRAELARDPALQARLAELHRLWQGLQPSPATPAPFGYVPKLQRLAEQRRTTVATSTLGRGAAPPWVRAMAAAALVAGVALGVGLGRMPRAAQEGAGPVVAAVPSGSPIGSVGSSTNVEPSVSVSSGGVDRRRDEIAADAEASTPNVAPTPTRSDAATSSERETTTAQRGDAGETASTESDSVESMLADSGASYGGGSTLAEEYWQALEGTGNSGGGGEGDAGW